MKIDFQEIFLWVAGGLVALWSWIIVRIFGNEKKIALLEAQMRRVAERTEVIEAKLEHLTPDTFADAVMKRMKEYRD